MLYILQWVNIIENTVKPRILAAFNCDDKVYEIIFNSVLKICRFNTPFYCSNFCKSPRSQYSQNKEDEIKGTKKF